MRKFITFTAMIKKISFELIFSLLFFLLINSCSSQDLKTTTKIYEPHQVHQKSEFVGGEKQFLKIINSNIFYPFEAIENNAHGKVIVKFVIEKNGTISNFEIIKDIGYGCSDIVIRALEKTQARWNPAKINNIPVRSYSIFQTEFRF